MYQHSHVLDAESMLAWGQGMCCDVKLQHINQDEVI